jgi:hypothetical protein
MVHQLRVYFEGEAQGLDADQLTLSVEVGGDNYIVCLFRQGAHRLGHALLRDGFEYLRVYKA